MSAVGQCARVKTNTLEKVMGVSAESECLSTVMGLLRVSKECMYARVCMVKYGYKMILIFVLAAFVTPHLRLEVAERIPEFKQSLQALFLAKTKAFTFMQADYVSIHP